MIMLMAGRKKLRGDGERFSLNQVEFQTPMTLVSKPPSDHWSLTLYKRA